MPSACTLRLYIELLYHALLATTPPHRKAFASTIDLTLETEASSSSEDEQQHAPGDLGPPGRSSHGDRLCRYDLFAFLC